MNYITHNDNNHDNIQFLVCSYSNLRIIFLLRKMTLVSNFRTIIPFLYRNNLDIFSSLSVVLIHDILRKLGKKITYFYWHSML